MRALRWIPALLLAACGGGESTAPITTNPPPATVASISLTPDSSDVVVRGSGQLAATTRDASGATLSGRTVSWSSSSDAIATVNSSGLVTAVSSGTVTITATSEGKSASARVRIVQFNLNAIVDSVRQAFNLPALGAAVISRTNGVYAIGVSGTRRYGQTLPVTVADKWHIGSNSKSFTALLAATAVKAGRMSWTDLLLTRYPELSTPARPEFRTTTLRDLATMRSGIIGNPNFTPAGTDAQMRAAVDSWAIQQAPAATPGNYYYSNIAYQMLGEVAARAWGQPFTQAVQDRVLAPMNITTAGFGPTTTAGGTDQPSGHTPNGSAWTVCEACDNAWALGSGKLHISLGDFARFALEELRLDAGQSALLSQGEARALTTGVTVEDASRSYAFGWEVFTNTTARVVTHDGSNTRNLSRALIYLDAGLAFVFVTNAADANSATGGAPVQAFDVLSTRLQSFNQNNR